MIARRLAVISMTVGDLDRAATFYASALGFEPGEEAVRSGEAFARLMGVEDARARVRTLRLGGQTIELVAFETPGETYPADSRSPDLWFQHFAIVVSDMGAAHERLMASGGGNAISVGGPQVLPASSGGVTAFKFRDPDGHPLELLAFPDPSAGPPAGINHSAVAVADTGRSEAFYTGMLGLRAETRSLNKGVEQERLDATFNAVVEVTGLRVGDGDEPHVELLCYRVPPTGRPMPRTMRANDIAATRLVIETDDLEALAGEAAEKRMALVSPGIVVAPDGTPALMLRDPDGHALVFRGGAAR